MVNPDQILAPVPGADDADISLIAHGYCPLNFLLSSLLVEKYTGKFRLARATRRFGVPPAGSG
jgi:hypothetical protein